jgi:hypothetical protein
MMQRKGFAFLCVCLFIAAFKKGPVGPAVDQSVPARAAEVCGRSVFFFWQGPHCQKQPNSPENQKAAWEGNRVSNAVWILKHNHTKACIVLRNSYCIADAVPFRGHFLASW